MLEEEEEDDEDEEERWEEVAQEKVEPEVEEEEGAVLETFPFVLFKEVVATFDTLADSVTDTLPDTDTGTEEDLLAAQVKISPSFLTIFFALFTAAILSINNPTLNSKNVSAANISDLGKL